MAKDSLSRRRLSSTQAPHSHAEQPGGQPGTQHVDCERHGMGMLTYTAGTRDHRAARQRSHMQMGGKKQ